MWPNIFRFLSFYFITTIGEFSSQIYPWDQYLTLSVGLKFPSLDIHSLSLWRAEPLWETKNNVFWRQIMVRYGKLKHLTRIRRVWSHQLICPEVWTINKTLSLLHRLKGLKFDRIFKERKTIYTKTRNNVWTDDRHILTLILESPPVTHTQTTDLKLSVMFLET